MTKLVRDSQSCVIL